MLLATAPPWRYPLRKDLLSQKWGTLVQTSGNSMSGPWTGRGGSRWPTPGGSGHHHFSTSTSTRHAYTLKWNLFIEWCSSHREDPRRCSITAMLSFLQQGLDRRLSPSTFKVYIAAITAHHDPVDGKTVGKHDLVVRFLRGARRLNPPQPPYIPSWNLSLVLRAIQQVPSVSLQSVELKFLSIKTLLLVALASIKRVGDLQAFSVDESRLEFWPAHVSLRPRPDYVPKVSTTSFRDHWWDPICVFFHSIALSPCFLDTEASW